jgi:hypothetical protein
MMIIIVMMPSSKQYGKNIMHIPSIFFLIAEVSVSCCCNGVCQKMAKSEARLPSSAKKGMLTITGLSLFNRKRYYSGLFLKGPK